MRSSHRKGLFVLLLAGLAAAGCEVEREGELPEIEVEGGQLPEYDVDAPDVDIRPGRDTLTIPLPDVDVQPDPDEGR